VPVISLEEYISTNWSNKRQIYRRSGGTTILYNYTVFADETGSRQSRYTKREYISNPIKKRLQRRGFTVNPDVDRDDYDFLDPEFQVAVRTSWRYYAMQNDSPAHCPVIIPMVYGNQAAKTQLAAGLAEGIKR
jgi:hypothetical protein